MENPPAPPPTDPQETCFLCPRLLEGVVVENPSWTYLRCGHKIHTHCFLQEAYLDTLEWSYLSCNQCDTRFISEQHIQIIRQHQDYRRNPAIIENLWETNETFREEIRELYKIQRAFSPILSQYKKERAKLNREWKEATFTSVNYLKSKIKEYNKKITNDTIHRKASRENKKFNDKRRIIMRKYNIGWRGLSGLRDIAGAPKIRELRFGSRRFRIRL